MSSQYLKTARGLMQAALLVGSSLLALAACGVEPTPPQPTPTASAPTGGPSATSTPAPSPAAIATASATANPGAPARLSGTVVAESDVSGQPDVPLAVTAVVAMPLERLAGLVGIPPAGLTDRELRFLSLTLAQRVAGMAVDLTDPEGHYEMTLPAGEYALCLAYPESSPAGPAGEPPLPLNIRGCGRLALEAGQTRIVDVSSGFGEILLKEKD
ncbi:MAG: hypothetical protein P8129_21730 [Anaerolineae bacterium]